MGTSPLSFGVVGVTGCRAEGGGDKPIHSLHANVRMEYLKRHYYCFIDLLEYFRNANIGNRPHLYSMYCFTDLDRVASHKALSAQGARIPRFCEDNLRN
jgi:hypothetical protein